MRNKLPYDVITLTETAKTVPFRGETERITKKMWPPAMQQHPGASLRFHCMARRIESPNDVTTSYATASRCISTVPLHGETDRITKWCDHQLCNSIQVHHYGSISWRIESPRAGTRYCVQYLIHQMSTASLARLGQMAPCPLHYLKREEREEKRRKFYIYPDVTHTHGRAGETLKGKRKKKADTRRADGQKQRRGGGNRRTSGTNLHGETDLTKPEHTPEPNDTLRRNQQEGDWGPMGTSWWKKETTKLIGTQVPKQDSVPKYLGFVRCSLSGTVVKSCPNWHKRLSSSIELGAQHVSPHQKPKWPHLQEEDMPVAFCRTCHVELQKLKLQW